MSIVMEKDVQVFLAATQFTARPATIELHDDGRLVLVAHGTGDGGNPGEGAAEPSAATTLLDVPASELRVGGSVSTLTLAAGESRYRVEFSSEARVLTAHSGLNEYRRGARLRAAQRLVRESGLPDWVAALRARGARIRYWSIPRIVGWTVGGTIGLTMLIAIPWLVISAVSSFLAAGAP